MKILGIETSCDETAAAVVADGKTVLSNVVISSLKDHVKFGGIIPEIASRRQMEFITTVVKKALKDANVSMNDIDAVAVTKEPGLIGSLLVGISFARALSFSLNKPLIDVDHIKAHLYANFLKMPTSPSDWPEPKLPAVGLIVSGGHSSLYLVKSLTDFKVLGQTRDDAVGEAFDKVAKILGLGYPGGPVIDRLAKEAVEKNIKFKSADLPGSLDFSFSGVKTAVLYYYRDHGQEKNFSNAEVAYGFQQSVVDILVKKCLLACKKYITKTLLVGGGVAANSALRRQLTEKAAEQNISVYFPPMALCLDNAAMIAGFGFPLFKKSPTRKSRINQRSLVLT